MGEFTERGAAGAAGELDAPHETPDAERSDSGAWSTGREETSAAPPEARHAPPDSWGTNPPPLRLTHVGAAPHDSAEMPAAPEPAYTRRAPRLLRLVRLLVGLTLLGAAWVATSGALMLGDVLLQGPPQDGGLSLHGALGLALYVLAALGALWLVVVALACIVAGAFTLSLALGARGW
jgi:hypothetical protein